MMPQPGECPRNRCRTASESISERAASRTRGVLLFMLIPIPALRHDLPFPTE